jgi:hypothetical protein
MSPFQGALKSSTWGTFARLRTIHIVLCLSPLPRSINWTIEPPSEKAYLVCWIPP